MRVVICWTEIAGYTAACWRELAARAGVELAILAWNSSFSRSGTKFERQLTDGLPVRLLEEHEQQDRPLVARLVTEKQPDLILIGGWAEAPYRDLVRLPALARSRIVLAMDSPWNATLRQRLARLKIGRFIDRLDAIFVPGARAAIFASRLRMPQPRIFRGMYGFDYRHFAPALAQRLSAGPWPRSFLYMGRYVPQKGLDILTAGYDRYRKSIPADPWPLVCHGSGPAKGILQGRNGVTVNDWVQPADQPGLLARHGAFILTSHSEPWGVAVAEAMASGLPAICSDRVGAVADLIRPDQNGLVIPSKDPAALAAAMRWMHDHHDRLPEMGRAAREAAAPYSAQAWADHLEAMARTLRDLPRRR